jgi:DNA-binding CsgD family transcriptional regulator
MAGLVGKLLLEVYRAARSTPSAEFQDAALECVKESLPFDSAVWGTIALLPDGARPHTGHLHHLPWQMIAEYERVKHLDRNFQAALARPGRTIKTELGRGRPALDPAMRAHCERWGMWQMLGTVLPLHELALSTGICLYRADPKRPFTERERRLMQTLAPHLAESFQFNTLHFLSHQAGTERSGERALARIDEHGVLHQAEPGLVALIRREVEDWSGPRVPKEWLSVLGPSGAAYRGKALIVTLLRSTGDLGYLLQVRGIQPVDRLSPREVAVVRGLANGKTHRAIAAQLGTSPSTVRTQIHTAYGKLGVRSKAELGRLLSAVD